MSRKWHQVEGFPNPQGSTYIPEEKAYNFSLYSKNATRVKLLIYGDDVEIPIREYEFNPKINKTQRIWHLKVKEREIESAKYYGYRLWGPNSHDKNLFHSYDPNKILLDPYAKNVFFPEKFSRDAASYHGKNDGKAPLAVLPPKDHNSGESIEGISTGHPKLHHDYDLIIYELHVRQFTANPNSGVKGDHRGTYQGIIDKIPYLKELGITAVELMPVQQWDPLEGSSWGYMTLNFFSPHKQYSSNQDIDGHLKEFKRMVNALNDAGIYVILDVVYNHTTEGDLIGPTYSFKGIDNSEYYLTHRRNGHWDYANFSGTGNTFYSAKSQSRRLILDSLRYWFTEMNVDGFRFDLGSIFALDTNGTYRTDFYTVIDQISNDPILRDIILIAEPWDGDLDDQGYLLGKSFPGVRWKQWNDRTRSCYRQFVKGDNGKVTELMKRLYGSNDIFPGPEEDLKLANKPPQSLNYITSHDGLTLYDMVSYTDPEHLSWDCGWEGVDVVPPKVMELRKQQVKNYITLLMLSNGTPMFRAGDEFLQTQLGQRNPYNVDDETVWLDWDNVEIHKDIFEFFKKIIRFRIDHPSIGRGRFWQEDVLWFGPDGQIDERDCSHTLAYFLSGKNHELELHDDDLYVMINAYWEPVDFKVMVEGNWSRIIDTSQSNKKPEKVKSNHKRTYKVNPRSIVVLLQSND